MCCKIDKVMTKVFQNLSGKITGWKVYVKQPKKVTSRSLKSIGWNYITGSHVDNYNLTGGTIKNHGIVKSSWNADCISQLDRFSEKGIHVYLDKNDAKKAIEENSHMVVCSDNMRTVKVRINPEDVLAVGELWNHDKYASCPFDDKTVPITLVAKKVYITRDEFRKATKKENK